MRKTKAEAITKIVYGETFSRYNKQEFEEFLQPLQTRLGANGISPSVFKGKRCLDAGCGGGRGTVLMALAGAAEVVAFDLSEENVRTTLRNADLFDLRNVRAQSGSLCDLPYPDETFDVVWCNGVLHHTVDPDLALREVVRVLRVGGNLWLYLYGSGGIYWFMVDFLRNWLRGADIRLTIAFLRTIGTSTGRIAEFTDDWYVPILKSYTHSDVSKRLHELGVPVAASLKAGMNYDTSQRRHARGEDIWMGEGDLRYWARKKDCSSGKNLFPLHDSDNKGSSYCDAPEIAVFREDFKQLAFVASRFENAFPQLKHLVRISLAARMQTWLRDTLAEPVPFSGGAFHEWIKQRVTELQTFV